MFERLNKKQRKIWAICLSMFCLIVLLFIFRKILLTAVASYLNASTTPTAVEVIFVLSGGAWERGAKAATLYHAGYANYIACTGANLSPDLRSYGMEIPESELTRRRVLMLNVDSTRILMLPKGTSTYEECVAITEYCHKRQYRNIMIVSSELHTRRILSVFTPMADKHGIRFQVIGASHDAFNENNWWTCEDGLLFVNNEYIKLMYYTLKY